MNRYFSEQALLQMRQEIFDAGGNEVFFLGRTDEAKLVVEVEPLARGNRDAVAAILVATSFGDVVIHNHPSGHHVAERSEEHTSELQSQSNLVCRLLLEK